MNKQIIKHLLDQKGMKWNYLIDKSGVSRRTFYAYLNGEWEASEDFKIRVSIALDVPVTAISNNKSIA